MLIDLYHSKASVLIDPKAWLKIIKIAHNWEELSLYPNVPIWKIKVLVCFKELAHMTAAKLGQAEHFWMIHAILLRTSIIILSSFCDRPALGD